MSGLTRSKGINRMSPKKRREIRESRSVVAQVLERDGGCVLRSRPDLAGPCFGEIHVHHLRKQSKRRGDWRHRAIVGCCDHHNGTWIEGNPIEARRLGLVVSDGDILSEAWRRMRTYGLAAGALTEPCPGSSQAPDTRPEAGLCVCMGCGHSYELTGGVLPAHDREVGW
ncbi:MAG: hypothetical protein ACRD0W_09675 [Acidimicrobiales bacterium]